MDKKNNFFHEFIAGNVGGLMGICTVYPLDTVKVRLQTHKEYTSSFDVLKKMIKTDGFRSLYRGLTSPAMGFGLTFAVSFSAYGYGSRQICRLKGIDSEKMSLSDMTLAGVFTGFVQSPVRQIIERVKTVMQVRERPGGRSPYSWSGACAIDLVRKEGLYNGLFQGFGSVLLREVPQFAVYYPCYELAKTAYSESGLFNPVVTLLLAGGTAGVVQWLPPFYCFDVIKSRMQSAPKGYYSGMGHCVRELLREGGVGIFFRGQTPALVRAFPLHALIFLGYEWTMLHLKKE
jgi:solute carrier family 25 (mitochondrial carnitine/acylcarnitine transporter), member 20/29